MINFLTCMIETLNISYFCFFMVEHCSMGSRQHIATRRLSNALYLAFFVKAPGSLLVLYSCLTRCSLVYVTKI